MIVRTGYILRRAETTWEVVIADDRLFIVAPKTGRHTDLLRLEAYPNDKSVNTLDDLKFQLIA